MAHRCRVLQQPDGSLVIIHPAMNDRARPDGIEDETWAQQCLSKTMAKHPEWQALPAVDMMSTELPTSREKRAGWRLVGGAVVEDDGAFQAAQTAERARQFDGHRLVKALAIWTLTRLLGRTPTAAERQQARDEILTIYRTL